MHGFREGAVVRRALILALAFQFLLGLAMMGSPWLHERLHRNAGSEHHECVVTVLHSGGTDGTTIAPVLAPDFNPTPEFAAVPKDQSCGVASIFLRGRVFEHAPPALA
ncbi:MAG TPA: hypothetical protein VH207_07645 [Chthoniobacterales bacterium]|nr:hypothetical protein [Chthoniobacterales bacterium]